MALTKISRGLLNTGVSDSSDATAITIDSSENVAVTGNLSAAKLTSNNGVLELDDNGSHNGIINVPASISINIDSDNGATGESFTISKDKTGINDTDPLFRVKEDGNVSVGIASAFGTTSNRTVLSVNGTNSATLNVGQGGSQKGYMFTDGNSLAISTVGSIPLVFGVNDQASNKTCRITTDGYFFIRTPSATTDGGQLQLSSSGDLYSMYVQNTGFASVGSIKAVERGATSAYSFAQWYSGRRSDTGGGDREFNFRGDGNAYADGSFNNSGADYAEYFESHTGSAIPRGTSVVLENNKVRAATSEDNVADIIGVVRPKEFGKNSMVIGNTAWNMWSEKYLTDDFNCYVMEDYSVVSWNDEDGELVTYESDNIPSDITVPDDAETNTHDENGVKFQRRALNPDFDASLTYEPREERDEWVIVGLIGQVQILDGQPTNDRWIKMRDISDTVEEWYIR